MKATIKYIYIAVLLSAPLAFGTTETWARLLISFAIFLCATLFFKDLWANRGRLLKVPGLTPLLAFGGLMLFQMVPLPAFLVKLISPATYVLYQDTAGLFEPVSWMRLTVDFKATVLQLIQFSAYVLFYLLTVQLLSEAKFLRKVVSILIWYGMLLASLALLNHFSLPDKLLWLRESSQGMSFGPYDNRSYYGGLMVMLFPVVFSMLVYYKPRISNQGFGEKIKAFFDHLSANYYLLLVLAVILMGVSLFAALSRAGILCLGLGLSLMGILMAKRKPGGRRGKMSATIWVGLILFCTGWFVWGPVFARFDNLDKHSAELANERLSARHDSLEIVKSYPIFGTGAGTFAPARRAFRTTALKNGFSEHAYNDYLKIMSEQGILGLVCFAMFIVAVLGSIRQFRKRKERYCIYLFCGAVGGLIAILIFNLVEDQLQDGANAIYFFFMSGLCIAAAHTRMRSVRRPSFLNTNPKERFETVIGSATVFLFFWGMAFYGGAYLGELNLKHLLGVYAAPPLTDADYKTVVTKASKAMFYDPLESRNLILLADAKSMLTSDDKNVLDLLSRAIRMNPMNSDNLQAAAKYFSSTGHLALAQKFYLAAFKYEPTNAHIRGDYGCWLMAQGFLKKGIKEMQTAITLAPGLTQKFVGRMAQLNLSYDEMANALPAMVRPFLELGEYLVATDQKKTALRAFQRAAKNLANEKTLRADWIERLCLFYLDREMLDDAFKAASIGIKYLPKDSRLRYTMGKIYEKMGVPYRAVKEYELAVVLDPQNISAIQRLEKLQGSS